MIPRSFIVLSACAVLAACAQQPTQPRPAGEPPEAAKAPPPRVVVAKPEARKAPLPDIELSEELMFMLMPLFMGFMFINFASGLVLYWLTGNVVGIAQQMLMNRFMPKPAPAVPSLPRKAPAKEN